MLGFYTDPLKVIFSPAPDVPIEDWPKSVTKTPINGLFVVATPTVSDPDKDPRGPFREIFRASELKVVTGDEISFVQGMQTSFRITSKNPAVLKGLHIAGFYKYTWCISGKVFVAIVDCRIDSPTRGVQFSITLNADDNQHLLIPPGCAHGVMATEDNVWYGFLIGHENIIGHEKTIRWNDPELGIPWPVTEAVLMKPGDANAPLFSEI